MWVCRSIGVFMVGSVIVTFRIMPKEIDTDLKKIEKEVNKKIKPQRTETIPIAFGLNALKIIKLVEEKEGEIDRITEEIMNIPGVQNVEVLDLTGSL